MRAYSIQNKRAWEYNAYEFWVKQAGLPSDRAEKDLENPVGMLKIRYFCKRMKIAAYHFAAVLQQGAHNAHEFVYIVKIMEYAALHKYYTGQKRIWKIPWEC